MIKLYLCNIKLNYAIYTILLNCQESTYHENKTYYKQKFYKQP